MVKNANWKHAGLTLLELTLAIALFAIVLAAAAQALISYHSALTLQRQRNEAVLHCRSVISEMRNVRENNPGDFPNAILSRWPNGGVVAGFNTLPQEQIVVAYTDVNANPLEVIVTCSWVDLRGRPAIATVSTLLTDR
ncbi:MAG TPA: prepilin-type N-terminal cleavage/methylation domain-containing protein [Candidatus Hydrogenedentes bacterium]|nr:prepilin-type N-terminal cleavage/methylation domain-containing protein [Candidatus Hydrogenedentota bacterium]HOL78327.1 prepilin-type N-terminal cleavage/methylation domain-containing protein [Candidatus Hydrogenedentota bacterium]HPO86313.1 prepilin-type N-terminal cleavage/methylation domain-containing protein [Candidatus Hydrogenedentota bacterium]